MENNKFYRTVFTIEVLSDEPLQADGMGLEEINYEITEGHCSGVVTTDGSMEVTKKEMSDLLYAQGSDPSFLFGDETRSCDEYGHIPRHDCCLIGLKQETE